MWDDMSKMAADRAAPERDVDTKTPLELCGALDGRRRPNESIELLERILDRDDGRTDCTIRFDAVDFDFRVVFQYMSTIDM